MSFKYNDLNDLVTQRDLNIHRKKGEVNKSFTIEKVFNSIIEDDLYEITEAHYSNKELISYFFSKVSHELLVNFANDLQYLIVLLNFNKIEPDLFSHENYKEWQFAVNLALDLTFLFSPQQYDSMIEKFNKKFPYIDFNENIAYQNYSFTESEKLDYFNNKYQILNAENNYDIKSKLLLSFVKKNYLSEYMDNIYEDFDENKRNCFIYIQYTFNPIINELSKEIMERNLSCTINWNLNFLQNKFFNEDYQNYLNISVTNMSCLDNIENVLFIGNIRDNKEIYNDYLNAIKNRISIESNVISNLNKPEPLRVSTVTYLTKTIDLTVNIIREWEEVAFLSYLEAALDSIENYESLLLSYNRKKNPFNDFCIQELLRKISDVETIVENVDIKNGLKKILEKYEKKEELNSFQGEVKINYRNSISLEININDVIAKQNHLYKNEIKKIAAVNSFKTLWKPLFKAVFENDLYIEPKTHNDKINLLVYEIPGSKMNNDELIKFAKELVSYIINKDWNTLNKDVIDNVEVEAQKLLMSFDRTKIDNTNSTKKRIIKF